MLCIIVTNAVRDEGNMILKCTNLHSCSIQRSLLCKITHLTKLLTPITIDLFTLVEAQWAPDLAEPPGLGAGRITGGLRRDI